MSSKYDNSSFNSNKKLLQKMTNQKMSKKGGESKDETNKRTFKVIELNGKVVDFGNFTIKKKHLEEIQDLDQLLLLEKHYNQYQNI